MIIGKCQNGFHLIGHHRQKSADWKWRLVTALNRRERKKAFLNIFPFIEWHSLSQRLGSTNLELCQKLIYCSFCHLKRETNCRQQALVNVLRQGRQEEEDEAKVSLAWQPLNLQIQCRSKKMICQPKQQLSFSSFFSLIGFHTCVALVSCCTPIRLNQLAG